jgi:hypothetical protein
MYPPPNLRLWWGYYRSPKPPHSDKSIGAGDRHPIQLGKTR